MLRPFSATLSWDEISMEETALVSMHQLEVHDELTWSYKVQDKAGRSTLEVRCDGRTLVRRQAEVETRNEVPERALICSEIPGCFILGSASMIPGWSR
jgi:hypothetical protein